MFQELREVLAAVGLPMDQEDLLDVLWLAPRIPSGGAAPLAAHVLPDLDLNPPIRPADSAPLDARMEPSALTAPEPGSEDQEESGTEPVSERAQYIGVTSGPGTTGVPAEPLWAPGDRALAAVLALGSALRPLKRSTPSRRRSELDEAATVTLRADTRSPQLVLRPQPERWLRLALVVDGGMSMLLWERQCAELKGLFERSGVFQKVETYQLRYGPGTAVRLGRQWTASSATRPTGSLTDASGRTMVLVVTDGAAAAWSDGRMRPVLEGWARNGPTAVIHTLPRRLWAGSGVRADTWQVTSPRPGAANRHWKPTDQVLPPSVAPAPQVPVPVLELTPAGFATWAAVNTVVGRPIPVRLWTPHRAVLHADGTAGSADDFGRAASPEALRLAAHLAALAPVTVPVMELVQACLDLRRGAAPLAEVMLGGLVQPLPQAVGARFTGRHRLFDFTAEAKDLLLDAVPTAELIDCGRRVGQRIESLVGLSSDFPAWPVGPGAAREDARSVLPFAYLGPALQARLGLLSTWPADAVAADPVVLSPVAGETFGWVSSERLGGSLRLLYEALGSHEDGFAARHALTPDELARYLNGISIPWWSFVTDLLGVVAGLPYQLPAHIERRLCEQYVEAALLLSPPSFAAAFNRVRDAMRSWEVPRDAELLFLHLLMYLDTPIARQQTYEREFVDDLEGFLDMRGLAVDRESPRGSRESGRNDLVWRADGHRYPVDVQRSRRPFTWSAFAERAQTLGASQERAPVVFLVALDDGPAHGGPLPIDECITYWTTPAGRPGAAPVVGLRFQTKVLPDMRTSAARRVCVAVDVAGFGRLTPQAQLSSREAMWAVVTGAVQAIRVSVDECFLEDRGDGLLLVLPSEADETTAVPRFLDALSGRLRRSSEGEESRTRLKVAMDWGTVASDTHGLVGEVMNRTCRLLDSAHLREAVKTSHAPDFALIVAEPLYESVPALHGHFQHVRVDLKNYRAWAWLQPSLPERPRASGLPDRDRSNAVLVGVGRYEELPDLPQVPSGLGDLAELLTDSWGGAFARDRTTVLANPETETVILDAVYEAADSASDTLLVYFAGHSLLDPNLGTLSLAVGRTRPDRRYTALPYDNIRNVLHTSRARNKIVILDCCYSGSALRTAPGGSFDIGVDTGDTVVIAASDRSAMAPAGLRYTAFTGELIGVLGEGLREGPELISVDSLYREVRQRLRAKNLPEPRWASRSAGGETALSVNRAHRDR
ncbi:SAV_2336 N-terminal domain-related protein [Streptomyces sp. NPDC059755]|uniref:caspase, EACC1-associated type n=1 Tax=Streptomyces sp. NPDC059755 TaxID=3346934 RepID=UPI00364998BB